MRFSVITMFLSALIGHVIAGEQDSANLCDVSQVPPYGRY
jgi:hypothetical protein